MSHVTCYVRAVRQMLLFHMNLNKPLSVVIPQVRVQKLFFFFFSKFMMVRAPEMSGKLDKHCCSYMLMIN